MYLHWRCDFEDQRLSAFNVAVVAHKTSKTSLSNLLQLFYRPKNQ